MSDPVLYYGCPDHANAKATSKSKCVLCKRFYYTQYARNNKERRRKAVLKYYKKNRKKIYERSQKYNLLHPWVKAGIEKRQAAKRKYSPEKAYKIYIRNAKSRGLDFELTISDFMSFHGSPCFYCGKVPHNVALDRCNNSIGYIPGNVISCCFICNRAKMNLSQIDFIEMCRRVVDRHKVRIENETIFY